VSATPSASPTTTSSDLVTIAAPGELGQCCSVEWSPDGKRFLVSGDRYELLDDGGRVLARNSEPTPAYPDWNAYRAVWLDSTTYAVGFGADTNASTGTVTIHRLDGSAVHLQGTYSLPSMVGSGHGALAVAPEAMLSDAAPTSFAVWSNGSLSQSIDGYPLEWSPDGSKLLVATSSPQVGGPAGNPTWVSVGIASYPDLRRTSAAAGVALYNTGFAAPDVSASFSPDGRSIAFDCGRRTATTNDCVAGIIDVAMRGAQTFPDRLNVLSWLPNGRLLVGSTTGSLQEWDGSKLVPSNLPSGTLSVSPTGVAAIATRANGQEMTRLEANGLPIVDLPAVMSIYWSPDGSHVLLVVDRSDAIPGVVSPYATPGLVLVGLS
jgi:hypothetical protein